MTSNLNHDSSQDPRHERVVAVAHPQEPLLLLNPPELLALVPHVLVRVDVNLVPAIDGVVITKQMFRLGLYEMVEKLLVYRKTLEAHSTNSKIC